MHECVGLFDNLKRTIFDNLILRISDWNGEKVRWVYVPAGRCDPRSESFPSESFPSKNFPSESFPSEKLPFRIIPFYVHRGKIKFKIQKNPGSIPERFVEGPFGRTWQGRFHDTQSKTHGVAVSDCFPIRFFEMILKLNFFNKKTFFGGRTGEKVCLAKFQSRSNFNGTACVTLDQTVSRLI